jgi:signal transduction histidine kinase
MRAVPRIPVGLAGTAHRSAPPLYRRGRKRLVGGVAGGIADHIGISAWAARLVFVLLAFSGGLGLLLYAAYWIVLPAGSGTERRRRVPVWVEWVAAVVVGVGVVAAVASTTSLWRLFVPAALACVGGALIWRQATEVQRQRWAQWSKSSLGSPASGQAGRVRFAAGVAFVVGGAAFVLIRADISAVRDGVIAVVVTLLGIGLITGPWWLGLVGELNNERRERIRSQERADIAAHLHDSVLQTLALIQRNAGSPREVTRLARGQERELRTLLYGQRDMSGQLAQSLRTVAGEVEDSYAVGVDVVVVGDAGMDEQLDAVLAAAREALVNAAKHAEVNSVSLYAEVEQQAVVVYVRDRGVGFDLAEVAADRQGVRGSIVGRIERHGGQVHVRTSKGGGTDVEIRMPHQTPADQKQARQKQGESA